MFEESEITFEDLEKLKLPLEISERAYERECDDCVQSERHICWERRS